MDVKRTNVSVRQDLHYVRLMLRVSVALQNQPFGIQSSKSIPEKPCMVITVLVVLKMNIYVSALVSDAMYVLRTDGLTNDKTILESTMKNK